ncbi:MAG: ABC transporter permease [Coraliomargaritaceae bacterium]
MTKQNRERAASSASSPSRRAWKRLCANPMAQIGSAIFLSIVFACFFGPLFVPHTQEAQNLAYGAQPPTMEHWFGTDSLGRDLFVRLLYGGRISIGVGFAATIIALMVGVTYGALAGYAGGRTENAMMRFVDAVYALPFTMVVIVLTVTFDQKSIFLIFMAIGLVEWLTMARIVRGQTRILRRQTYIEAAQVNGSSHLRILLQHILPNLMGSVIVYTTLTIPSVILLESIISFLGLGVQPPMASWGTLIHEGAQKIDDSPWLLVFPALFFSLTIFSLNFLGDGLRDSLDPKEKAD